MKDFENIVNLVTGNISPEDKDKILTEITTGKEDKNVFRKIKFAWALLSSTKELQDYDVEKSYVVLKARISKKDKPLLRISTFIKYAAIFILLIGFPFLFYLTKQHKEPLLATEIRITSVVAENGQISKVILPDSSIVWLNSGTTLSYNSGYSFNNRDLALEGQAYLNVKKDQKKPLVVSCKDLQVKVLGTKFDVSAYPGDDKIKVVLETGKVELLQAGNNAFKYELKPGEMAQYDTRGKKAVISEVETNYYTNWKEGYLIFQDTPMKEVIEKLERKFNVKIIVKSSEIYKSIFNANFKDENLKEILDYIEYSCPIQYKIVENKNTNPDKSIIEFTFQSN
jgi:ferric-dicitrate binding protein FerR (iron transport regulator)